MISYNVMKYNKVLCIACAIAVAFITLFCSCVTAFAENPFIPNALEIYDVEGVEPLTVAEAKAAAFELYEGYFGVDKDNMEGMLCFVVNSDKNTVEVYSLDYPDYIFDIIYMSVDGYIKSVGLGYGVLPSAEFTLHTVINKNVDYGFDFATKAFNWIVENPIASFLLGLSFAFAAFNLLQCGIRTVRRI